MPVFNASNPVSVGLATKVDHYDRVFNNTVGLYAGEMSIASQVANAILFASSTTQLAVLAPGPNGKVVTSRGSASAPVWGPSPIAMAIVFGG